MLKWWKLNFHSKISSGSPLGQFTIIRASFNCNLMNYLDTVRPKYSDSLNKWLDDRKRIAEKSSDDYFVVCEFPHLDNKGSPLWDVETLFANQIRKQLSSSVIHKCNNALAVFLRLIMCNSSQNLVCLIEVLSVASVTNPLPWPGAHMIGGH